MADTHPTRKDENGEPVRLDLSFAPKMRLKTVYSREHPGMLVRRHFEAMVFACLVEELRCGDVAVIGAEDYGDWTRMLLPWEQCEPKLAGFCKQAGIPATASEFTVRLRERLTTIAETVDAGYPDNKDLTIDPVTGVPSLALRRAGERTASAEKLEEALSERLPARSVLEHLARAAHWTDWWKRPGPRSGSEPKLKEPLPRYVTTAFVYGSRLGPAQAVRHMRGSVAAHEIGAIAKRHFTIGVLNRCGADVVNAHAGLDLTAAWGDGSVAAVDGTMMDTDEAYNGYTKWLHFGGDGYRRSRDPELQEKAVKFLDLMANSIIFSTTVDMTDTLRQMAAQGWELSPDDIAALSPHRRDNVLRFGDYDTATLHIPPGPYNSALRLPADGV